MKKVEWKERKTSLGNAIIIGAVMAVLGVFVGMNWDTWYNNFAPYLGFTNRKTSDMDWTPLNEVYNQLSVTFNGTIDKNKIIDGAKKGLVEALEDPYTLYNEYCIVRCLFYCKCYRYNKRPCPYSLKFREHTRSGRI